MFIYIMTKIKTLYYDIIDVSEGININKKRVRYLSLFVT